MKAWQIFTHSVRQVFGNLTDALRISGLLYIVQLMLAVALGVTPEAGMHANPLKLLVVVGVALVFSLWIAVAWHRFVLGGEGGSSLLPQFHGPEIWRYLGRSLVIGLLVVALGAVLGMALVPLAIVIAGPVLGGGVLGPVLVMIPVFMVMFRLSASLPGVAMGHGGAFAEGWTATAGETGTIFGLALITTALALLLGAPEAILPFGSIPALLWSLVAGWMQMMIGVSVLTTLYGHYIQKRPLV